MTTQPSAGREQLVAYLRSQLIGPADGIDEVIADLPSGRYASGILYPVGTEFADAPPIAAAGDDPVVQTTRYFPSAAGLSFIVESPGPIDVRIAGARYEPGDRGGKDESGGRGGWRRIALGDPSARVEGLEARIGQQSTPVLDGRARLHLVGRTTTTGLLVTIAVVNAVEATSLAKDPRAAPSKRSIAEHCVYQLDLAVSPTPHVLSYPTADVGVGDAEDAELAFQYRGSPAYAVGHGAAADWSHDDGRTTIRAEFLPATLVPSVRFDRPTDRSEPSWGYPLDLLELDRLANDPDLSRTLDPFAAAYEAWIGSQHAALEGSGLGAAEMNIARGLVEKQRTAAVRIRSGLEALTPGSVALLSFRFACEALADQMRRPALGARRRKAPALRPFQLAFALSVIPGLIDPEDPHRNVVDLLWFPTGGGKTEAYLFLAAFEIFRRRIANDGTDDGTVVLSRYTLRLLTTQQFQRTVALACAAELIRRRHVRELGTKPITVGLWVGEDHTPNSYSQAVEPWLGRWTSGSHLLPLPSCPWCGTALVDRRSGRHGIEATTNSFALSCISEICPFGSDHRLPAQIVDQGLYDERPSIVIGTIDKLAQLPLWGSNRASLLGGPGRPGPSLVLQDELHLLSGPLGTTAALYEIGVDAVLAAGPGRPKVIASTATIRRAVDQARGLFGRDLALFPPNGLSPDDSFYSVVDDRPRTSRLYVGVMSVGGTWQSTTVYTMTALAQGVLGISTDQDAYWTSLVYANSIEDHGRVATLVADDVRTRLRQLAPAEDAARSLSAVEELRGAGDTATLIDVLARLELPMGEPGALDAVVTTNLIQVGIDIQRLGLIIFVGQPKGVSEYIQASSRVGRDEAAPGLIVTVFSHTRPRDRSHFEAFRSFHESLYRWVEPMSITPFSVAALDRFLPAVVATTLRHGTTARFQADGAAADFRLGSAEADAGRTWILGRAVTDDEGDAEALVDHLDRLFAEWDEQADGLPALVFSGGGKDHRQLLRPTGERRGLWDVQRSMRSVEAEVRMHLYAPSDGGRR